MDRPPPPDDRYRTMHHDAGTFQSADGLELATRRWTPHEHPKATVALVHGINEHSGRYAHVATHLMLHDVEVVAYDQRGHGRSEGQPRAYVETFDDYVDDLARFLAIVRAEIGDRPLFLYGHSMGGAVAASYVIEHGPDGLAGLVLSSAALQIPSDLSPALQKAAGVLSRFIPRVPLPNAVAGLDRDNLSRDPAVVRAYEEDPLVYTGGLRPRTGAEVLRASRHIAEHPEAFTLPLYLFHGTADTTTDPAGSQSLYDRAPSDDKTLKLYEGLFHETHNEPERERVLNDLTDWLDAHV